MGVKILFGNFGEDSAAVSERAVLVDSVTNIAFGPVLDGEEHAERLIEACAVLNTDPRKWDADDLVALARATALVALTSEAHLDHELDASQLHYLLECLADRVDVGLVVLSSEQPTILTVDLSPWVGKASCALYGPIMGDAPVTDAFMQRRGDRAGESRMVRAPLREVRQASIVVGPHKGRTVVYTAFGGPVAPREPWDPSLDDSGRAESEAFWAEHALATGAA